MDTRSDVYSLGVLLYELLTGTPPFKEEDLLSVGLDEMRRIIREQDPERPSTRLRRAGADGIAGNAAPAARRSPFASDLDLIVLKALEKEPDRRYPTANGLAMDIRRYLANEPVIASPPSALYRFRKYCRRRRSEVIAGTTIALLLLAGSLISASLAVRARRAERRAKTEAATSAAVAEFYWRDLLKQLSPGDFPNRTVTLREALDVAEQRAPIRLAGQPLAEATVSLALGAAYTRLFDYARARRHIQRAVDVRSAHLGENNLLTVEAVLALADNCQFRREDEAALANFTRARMTLEHTFGPRDPETVRAAIGEAWFRAASLPYAAATNLLGGLAMLSEEVRRPNDIYSRIALNYLALTHQHHGALEEASRLLEESYRRALLDEGPEGGNALLCQSRLAGLEAAQGKYAGAERRFREVLAVRVRNYGPAHPLTLAGLGSGLIESILLPQQRYREALDELERHIGRCAADPNQNWNWRAQASNLVTRMVSRMPSKATFPTREEAGVIQAGLQNVRRLLGMR